MMKSLRIIYNNQQGKAKYDWKKIKEYEQTKQIKQQINKPNKAILAVSITWQTHVLEEFPGSPNKHQNDK